MFADVGLKIEQTKSKPRSMVWRSSWVWKSIPLSRDRGSDGGTISTSFLRLWLLSSTRVGALCPLNSSHFTYLICPRLCTVL